MNNSGSTHRNQALLRVLEYSHQVLSFPKWQCKRIKFKVFKKSAFFSPWYQAAYAACFACGPISSLGTRLSSRLILPLGCRYKNASPDRNSASTGPSEELDQYKHKFLQSQNLHNRRPPQTNHLKIRSSK
jgi:hypothetical protein